MEMHMGEFVQAAKSFFSLKVWDKIENIEKQDYGRQYYIYYSCLNLDIKVVMPVFMQKHTELEANNIFCCKFCDTAFTIHLERNKHEAICRDRFTFIKTEDKMKHNCDQCSYTTNNKKALRNHKIIHNKTKPFACALCGNKFTQKSSLKTHIKHVHTKEVSFKCEQCSFTTAWAHVLRRHIKVHTNEKSFVCLVCYKEFSQKGHYNEHMLTHDSEKQHPYQCKTCNMTFRQNNFLKRHNENVHLRIIKFQCSMCEYQCGRKDAYKKHMLTHLTEKNVKCDLCPYTCTHEGLLKRHVNKHHAS